MFCSLDTALMKRLVEIMYGSRQQNVTRQWLFRWRPSGVDLGHPADASCNRRPYPCVHGGRGRDQSDPVGRNAARLDRHLLQQSFGDSSGLNLFFLFSVCVTIWDLLSRAAVPKLWVGRRSGSGESWDGWKDFILYVTKLNNQTKHFEV